MWVCASVLLTTCLLSSVCLSCFAHNTMHATNAGPKGVYREPVSVASLDWPVTVLTYQQVLQRYPGLSGAEALQAYEDDHRAEVEEGDNASGRTCGMGVHPWKRELGWTQPCYQAGHVFLS